MADSRNTDLTSSLVKDLLKEKRSERRWKNIRFVFWFALIAYITLGIFKYMGGQTSVASLTEKYVALVRLDGMIAPGKDSSGAEILPTLHDAFKDSHAVGVVIDINSPGGTPV